jgi:hypothetical protein
MHVPAPLGRCHVVLVGGAASNYFQSGNERKEISPGSMTKVQAPPIEVSYEQADHNHSPMKVDRDMGQAPVFSSSSGVAQAYSRSQSVFTG